LLFSLTPDNSPSELTYKFDVLCRFVNLDETHHSKSLSGNKGGSRSKSLVNPNFPRLGSRFAKDSGNHTTGCYGSNPLEALLPVYIYDSNVKDQTKLKIRQGWVDGLPVSTGQWGFGRKHTMDVYVCAKKGEWGRALHCDGALLRQPLPKHPSNVLMGRDNAPLWAHLRQDRQRKCRQTKNPVNLQFRYDMHKMGVYIGPGLPNSTAAIQEMNDLHETFKAMYNNTSQDVFTNKTYTWALAVQRLEEASATGKATEEAIKMIKPAQFNNYNIPDIVHGKAGYNIKKRPLIDGKCGVL
jgi:hypothetical protein